MPIMMVPYLSVDGSTHYFPTVVPPPTREPLTMRALFDYLTYDATLARRWEAAEAERKAKRLRRKLGARRYKQWIAHNN